MSFSNTISITKLLWLKNGQEIKGLLLEFGIIRLGKLPLTFLVKLNLINYFEFRHKGQKFASND